MSNEKYEALNFIEQIIEKDNETGKFDNRVHTRFPPEPNGFLHIGHALAICTNFGMSQKYGGKTNLRFDDTNPIKEDTKYVDAIKKDIEWLGFKWNDEALYASDYFGKLYDFAVQLIKMGKAYVDDTPKEQMSEMRGTTTKPGTPSEYRDRTVEENLDLFERMQKGEFKEGSRVLRAKIDLASPNMLMRDPIMYRILKAHHHRTGDTWNIYPMYDFAHGVSDSIEGITHSLCSLEFEVHRPLYEWFNKTLGIYEPQQIEFARLNLNYTVMSKRKLLQLVEDGTVNGWDDPRMPTISGMRRRGYTAAGIQKFVEKAGISRRNRVNDFSLLEFSVKEDLNKVASRVMGVLNPVKLIITNFPEGETEYLEIDNNPEDENSGSRKVPFTRELYIEREDFMEDAPKKFFRLSVGRNVRLKGAFIIHCEGFKKDENGNLLEVHCTYYPDSKSGEDTSGIKAKGTLHWVSTEHAVDAEVRIYDRLFNDENPDGHKEKTFYDFLNPDSLTIIKNAKVEPSLKESKVLDKFQFLRKGYFCVDDDSTSEALVFNKTVGLRDSWAKKNK